MEIKSRNNIPMCHDCMHWWINKKSVDCPYEYICSAFFEIWTIPMMNAKANEKSSKKR